MLASQARGLGAERLAGRLVIDGGSGGGQMVVAAAGPAGAPTAPNKTVVDIRR